MRPLLLSARRSLGLSVPAVATGEAVHPLPGSGRCFAGTDRLRARYRREAPIQRVRAFTELLHERARSLALCKNVSLVACSLCRSQPSIWRSLESLLTAAEARRGDSAFVAQRSKDDDGERSLSRPCSTLDSRRIVLTSAHERHALHELKRSSAQVLHLVLSIRMGFLACGWRAPRLCAQTAAACGGARVAWRRRRPR